MPSTASKIQPTALGLKLEERQGDASILTNVVSLNGDALSEMAGFQDRVTDFARNAGERALYLGIGAAIDVVDWGSDTVAAIGHAANRRLLAVGLGFGYQPPRERRSHDSAKDGVAVEA